MGSPGSRCWTPSFPSPIPQHISSLFRFRREGPDLSCDSCPSCFSWLSYYLHSGRLTLYYLIFTIDIIEKPRSNMIYFELCSWNSMEERAFHKQQVLHQSVYRWEHWAEGELTCPSPTGVTPQGRSRPVLHVKWCQSDMGTDIGFFWFPGEITPLMTLMTTFNTPGKPTINFRQTITIVIPDLHPCRLKCRWWGHILSAHSEMGWSCALLSSTAYLYDLRHSSRTHWPRDSGKLLSGGLFKGTCFLRWELSSDHDALIHCKPFTVKVYFQDSCVFSHRVQWELCCLSSNVTGSDRVRNERF